MSPLHWMRSHGRTEGAFRWEVFDDSDYDTRALNDDEFAAAFNATNDERSAQN